MDVRPCRVHMIMHTASSLRKSGRTHGETRDEPWGWALSFSPFAFPTPLVVVPGFLRARAFSTQVNSAALRQSDAYATDRAQRPRPSPPRRAPVGAARGRRGGLQSWAAVALTGVRPVCATRTLCSRVSAHYPPLGGLLNVVLRADPGTWRRWRGAAPMLTGSCVSPGQRPPRRPRPMAMPRPPRHSLVLVHVL